MMRDETLATLALGFVREGAEVMLDTTGDRSTLTVDYGRLTLAVSVEGSDIAIDLVGDETLSLQYLGWAARDLLQAHDYRPQSAAQAVLYGAQQVYAILHPDDEED